MPVKDLHHRLTADARGFQRGFSQAERSARALEQELARQEARQARVDAAMQRTGRVLIGFGAAIAAGLALSTRAAMQWESAWAGVAKTLDTATAPQLAALEEDLRGLARELPQSHQEIAAVAAAAGQLGVAAPDIAEFTRTMVDLGVTTNLSSEEAAFAIARMANIMGTSQDDVRRLASTIVDLGNNSATTEAEITAMALRIAGAGQTIGLSEAQVLSFAAALSSVGIRAESGGTAISRVFLEIDTAVSQGGEALETFAQTAGMSAQDFKRAYERDAGSAIAAFIAGLGRVQTTGGNVNEVLDKLGLTEIRVSDALRRLAGNGTILNESLRIGNDAWDENIALTVEAERRYGTVEARMGIARNQLNDFAISIGQTFLPVLGEMVDRGAALVSFLNDLPGPVKTALGVVAGLTAAIALAGGAALLAVPKIAAFKGALDTLENSGGRTATAVRGLRRGLGAIPWGPLGLALTAATIGFGIFAAKQADAKRAAEEFADTLDDVTGKITEASRVLATHKLFNDEEAKHDAAAIREAADLLGISVAELVDIVLSGEGAMDRLSSAVASGNKEFRLIDGELVRSKASTDEQARAWVVLSDEVERVNGQLISGEELWQLQQEALEGTTVAASDLNPEQRQLAENLGVTADRASELSGELDELDKELQAIFDSVFALQNAQDALDDQFDKLREQVQRQREEGDKYAGSLDGNSEAARRNREESQKLLELYGQLALETLRQTESQEEAEQVAKNFEQALDDLEEQTGLNVRELEGYNDIVSEIERLIEVHFETPGYQEAKRRAEQLKRLIDGIDRTVSISWEMHGSGAAPAGGTFVMRQHGGIVPGPSFPVDRVPVAATGGEFISTVAATQRNRAALEAANAGARLAVVGGSTSTSGGGTGAAAGGSFTGTLVLSSGEFLGVVDGRIEAREARLVDRITAGTGAAR